MSLAAGSKLGPFEILAQIGAGGMGEVYRARDTKLKRDVALKVLPEAFARDPERMARFQREAEVLASLNHPNIATIHGVEDRALVMELVEGESPKGPLPFDEAWKIASQIAAALEYAHERGIMHRDLKPANIMITPDGVVKLLDFGLAKAFSNKTEPSASPENSPTLTLGATEIGVILGTAAYMAPEQARGKTVDKRADIWSFGVVLYELLTGERLFTGQLAARARLAVLRSAAIGRSLVGLPFCGPFRLPGPHSRNLQHIPFSSPAGQFATYEELTVFCSTFDLGPGPLHTGRLPEGEPVLLFVRNVGR